MTRIAVVNDDTIFLEMMAAVLEEQGWETRVYKEKGNAFAKLQQDPPDLIILDIRMESPETGWTLLELFTLDRRLCTIPVIVCSAAIMDLRVHEDWLNQNGIAVLPKPFNIKQLYDEVEEALQRESRPNPT
jgi:CheY-like chemotaxis protein